MFKGHVTNQLSAYVNGELSKDEARRVGEHLLACARCRKKYDEVRFVAQMAQQLPEVAAPDSLWSDIEALLDKTPSPTTAPPEVAGRPRRLAFNFGWQQAAFAAAVLVVMLGIAGVWYNSYLSRQIEEGQKTIAGHTPPLAVPAPVPIPEEDPVVNPNAAAAAGAPGTNSDRNPGATSSAASGSAGSGIRGESWEVARLEGRPKVGATELAGLGKISVGEWLETDKTSRARITVGEIGHVDVAPNTRIRLVEAKANEHRLALAVGKMHAQILAPPRIFFVNTPSAQAIDLGCEYTLDVDESGASVLRVLSGWVAFVSHGRESLVPEGALAITRPGQAPGTPYFVDASNRFKEALTKFDFSRSSVKDRAEALTVLIQEARARDTLTLWHLLSRVAPPARERLFEKMVNDVPLPDDVTREGILRLDKEMLRLWRLDLEVEWYRHK